MSPELKNEVRVMETSVGSDGSKRVERGPINRAVATIIGIAMGLFVTVPSIFSFWIVLPFAFLPLLGIAVLSTTFGILAARGIPLPRLGWRGLIAALLLLPSAVFAPYAGIVGELYYRVDRPSLPSDWGAVYWRPSPLSGGTSSGPAPGFIAEHYTPLDPDAAMESLRQAIGEGMTIHRATEYLYAIPDPDTLQVLLKREGSGSYFKIGVYGNYRSALPGLIVAAGIFLIVGTFIFCAVRTRRTKTQI